MAPAVGFEPTTKWLTATYSTAELCRSVVSSIIAWYVINILHFRENANAFPHFFVFFSKSALWMRRQKADVSILYAVFKGDKSAAGFEAEGPPGNIGFHVFVRRTSGFAPSPSAGINRKSSFCTQFNRAEQRGKHEKCEKRRKKLFFLCNPACICQRWQLSYTGIQKTKGQNHGSA